MSLPRPSRRARKPRGFPPAGVASLAAAGALAGALLIAAAGTAGAQQPIAAHHRASVVRFASHAVVDLDAVPLVLRQPVTMRLRKVSVERALQEVMARAGVSLTYSRAVVPLDRVVSLDVENETVIEALRRVLAGAKVDEQVELWISAEGRMALVPGEPAPRESRNALAGTISGRVTEAESGAPLPNATVTVAGTRLGTTSGPDGRYTLAGVPNGSQLLYAARIGFGRDSQRVTVAEGQTATADFALKMLAVRLTEVVTIGYGETERRTLTGAVSSVSAEEIERQPVTSLDQALVGRAPGVQVVTSSGQPGANAVIRIRGGNSISAGNDPLYVVDGVPILASAGAANTSTLQTQGASGLNPVAAINPNDIESIEILKDASATGIYGARAANGVVLITTKRGRAGRSAVTFGSYYGVQSVRRRLPVLNATDFARVVNQAYANAGQTLPYTDAQIAALGAGTDWQDAIFRDAPVRNYELSISGGDQDTRYYISGNLLRQDGIVIGTNLDRGAFRLNLDQDVSSKFRVGNRLTLSRSEGQVLPNGGAGSEASSVVLNAITAPPTLPVRTEGGDYFIGLNTLTGRPFSNPVATALDITNEEQQNRIIGNGFAEYDLTGALRLRTTLGVDYLTSLQNFYSPSNTYPGRTNNGFGSRGTRQTTTWQNENTVNYRAALGQMHDLDLLGGLSLQRINSENVSGTAQGFLTDRLGVNGLNTGKTFVGVWTGAPHSSLLSYFARANYNLADRYLFTLTGRRDGSSRFGKGNQYAFFPSAAFAWRASEEGFVRQLGLFDDLKLRTSWGQTGNQDIGNYSSLATLGSRVYVFNGVRSIGFAPDRLANPDLKWETTDQFDAGIDIAVFRSRLAVTADYYNKKTNDLLLDVTVPATSGFGSSLQNIGSVRNRGFELGINTVNLEGAFGGAFGWTSSLNLAWNRNEVLNLGKDSIKVGPTGVGAGAVQNPTVLKVGEPLNSFYGWVYDRMENGQPVYKDLNGDGEVTPADRAIIGNAQPKYSGGFANRFTFRNLELSAFIQFSVGNKIYNINRSLLTNVAGNANQLTDVLGAGENGIPTPKIGNTFNSRESSLFVEDGSYVRGKNLRLAFRVPERWLGSTRAARLSGLKLYVSAQNWFTSTDYTGFDPEISEYALNNLAQGFDFGTYPQARQLTFGFNAGF